MASKALRKLFEFLLTLFLASTAVFFMARLAPSDPVEIMLGENATFQDREALRKELKLDLPLIKQYSCFLTSLVNLELGNSLVTKRKVMDEIKDAMPYTAKLGIFALLISLIVGASAGFWAALKENKRFDRFFGLLSSFMIVSPSFLSGPILLLVFAVEFPVFPVSGDGSFLSFCLPSLVLAIPVIAYFSRIIRVSMVEEKKKLYVLTAKEKGLSEKKRFLIHLFPNSLIPFVQVAGLEFGALLTGAIITEKIFRIPGLGSLLAKSVFSRDYTLLTSLIILFSLVYLLGNLLADIVSAIIDPRIRHES
jgi:ABC-type dipeptide/oligopeptide/nickel transport system permease component